MTPLHARTRPVRPPVRPQPVYTTQVIASNDPPSQTFEQAQAITREPITSQEAHRNGFAGFNSRLNPQAIDWDENPRPYTPVGPPDSWINSPDYEFYRRPTSYYKPPKLELVKFDGNPLNWPLFIQSFKVQVHDAVGNDSERIAHLNNCLAPEVGAQLGISLRDPGLYRYALQELQATYGSQIVIAKTCSSILRSLRRVPHGDYAALSKLSASLKSIVATYQLCGFDSELKSYDSVDRVLSCLPD